MVCEIFNTEGAAILFVGDHEWLLALRAWESCPFFWLGAWVVYWWGRRAFGALTGLLANSDFYLLASRAGACGPGDYRYGRHCNNGAAFVALLVWIERPNTKRNLLFGLVLASAVLSKSPRWRFCGCSFGIGDFMDAGRARNIATTQASRFGTEETRRDGCGSRMRPDLGYLPFLLSLSTRSGILPGH